MRDVNATINEKRLLCMQAPILEASAEDCPRPSGVNPYSGSGSSEACGLEISGPRPVILKLDLNAIHHCRTDIFGYLSKL